MKNMFKLFGIVTILIVSIFVTFGCSNVASASDFQFEVVSSGLKITNYTGDGLINNLIIPKKINGMPVTIIGNAAFINNKKIVSVTIPDTVIEIEDGPWNTSTGAFRDSSLSSIKLSKNLKKIGSLSFYNCNNLTSIIIPNSVTVIGPQAFQGCSNLVDVKLSKSITEIGMWAFGLCKNLNEESYRAIQALGYEF